MPDYKVKIVRTITTVVRIEAASLSEAHQYAFQQGATELYNDAPVLLEDEETKIKSIQPIDAT